MVSVTNYAPRLLQPDDINVGDRALILLHLARKWDDLLLGLEKDPTALGPDLSLAVMVQLIRPWTHPLLTDLNALDLFVGLVAAVKAQDQYLLFGDWDAEHDDAMSARSVEERHALLAKDVHYSLFGLLHALTVTR